MSVKNETLLDLVVPAGASIEQLREQAAMRLGYPKEAIHLLVVRRSLDARKGRPIVVRYKVRCSDAPILPEPLPEFPRLNRREDLRVLVVGSGPSGLFAALRLAEAGVRVTLVEQGRMVQQRRRDIARLLREGYLDPSSNYCFGEGGAGTFSDGKLYTRVKDRDAVRAVLGTLVRFGAPEEILIEGRPHVGSNRLPKVLMAIRRQLEELGCEFIWEQRVEDLEIEKGRVRGVRLSSGSLLCADAVILACGHSARPLFEALARRGIALAAKPFAIGLRIEHPQKLVDEIQYGRRRVPGLPPAFYELSTVVEKRGVYSFCMCPGGWVVPASTESEGLCTNGMSLSRRDSPFANAALVVTVEPHDWGMGVLGGMEFQRSLERAAFALGGGGQRAPAQRATDFIAGRCSVDLPSTSYRPGVSPADLAAVLPHFAVMALREALKVFERRMPGFLSREALLLGIETRTSSPVVIMRDKKTLQSVSHPGLYPTGEGSGHAGGIVSSAIDGARVAEAVVYSFSR